MSSSLHSHGSAAGRRGLRSAGAPAFGLAEALLAIGLLASTFVLVTHLFPAERAGAAALDRELQAVAAATSVLEVLQTVPYAALPSAGGEPGIPDVQWKTLELRCPGWEGGDLGQRFHPLNRDGPFERWLQLQEQTPWQGCGRSVKFACVTVRWALPGVEDRAGQVVLRTVLSPAAGVDETTVLEP